MDWQSARSASPADAARQLTVSWIVFVVVVMSAVTAAGQDRSTTAVKYWRVIDSPIQPDHIAIEPQLSQGSHTAQPSLPPPVQATYEAMPYVGEFVPDDRTPYCDALAACGPACGCSQQDCCPDQLLPLSPSARGYWLSGEYLLWSISGSDLPPLVTTSSPGTLPEHTGVLSRPGTTTLFGGDSGDLTRSGFRIAGGWWLDAAQTAAIELSYAGLPRQTDRDTFNSLNFPLLARPVFDTLAGAESAMLVAHPDFLSGDLAIHSSSQFHLAGAFRRDRISQSRCRTVDSLFGFRFGALEESLRIEQSSRFTVGTGQVIGGTTIDLFDRFETQNRFYGVALGLDVRERFGAWVLDARGSLSLGNNHAEVMIDGATVTSVPGDITSTAVGGLLAQQTNIANVTRNKFSVMPELSLGLSTHLNRCWQVNVGYHLLYWSDAARPGGQIDRRVSQFPPQPPTGTFDPSFEFDTRGVLIHGLQTGLIYQF